MNQDVQVYARYFQTGVKGATIQGKCGYCKVGVFDVFAIICKVCTGEEMGCEHNLMQIKDNSLLWGVPCYSVLS